VSVAKPSKKMVMEQNGWRKKRNKPQKPTEGHPHPVDQKESQEKG